MGRPDGQAEPKGTAFGSGRMPELDSPRPLAITEVLFEHWANRAISEHVFIRAWRPEFRVVLFQLKLLGGGCVLACLCHHRSSPLTVILTFVVCALCGWLFEKPQIKVGRHSAERLAPPARRDRNVVSVGKAARVSGLAQSRSVCPT